MKFRYTLLLHSQKKILLLSAFIIPVLTLISINSIDIVNGQILNQTTSSSTLIQSNPGSIEPQPLLNERGQTIALGGSIIYIKDPLTGEIVPKEVRFQDPKITGPSLTQTESSSSPNLEQNLKLMSMGIPTYPIAGSKSVKGLVLPGQNNTAGLFSTSNPVLQQEESNAVPTPTYNPPLKKCETIGSNSDANSGGFDVAKYVVTGKMNQNIVKGDSFAFQIFSDLVRNDGVEISGEDAPYKANIMTSNGESPIQIDEIATVCVDVQQVSNGEEKKVAINPENSNLFKSLNF